MKGPLLLLFVLSIAMPAGAQYIDQCLTISGFADADDNGNGYNITSTIQANASKELVLIGNNKLFRVSKEGSKLWEKTLTAGIYDYAIDASGNAIVIHNGGTKLVKYNSNGSLAWEKTNVNQYLNGLNVDDSGNVYVTGYDNNTGGLLLIKYAANGNLAWQKIGSAGNGREVVASSGGDVFVIGYDYDNGGLMLIKYSSNGTFQWQSSINNSIPVQYLKLGPDGNLYCFLSDNFTTRIYKISPSTGVSADDVLLDYGHIVAKFGAGNSIFILGTLSTDLYSIYKLNSNFTGAVFRNLQYFKLNDWDYRSLEVESDGVVTASIISGYDSRQGAFYRINSSGTMIGGEPVLYNDFPTTGHVVDYQGSYLVATNYDCLKKLTPCDKIPFSINSQPTNQTVCSGTDTQFTFGVTGQGLLYQWRKGSQLLKNDSKYAGANSATLTIKAANPVDDAGSYSCVVIDGCYVEPLNPGDPERKLTSQAVNIAFIGPASITAQPANVSQCAGTDAVFQITSTGGQNVKYQWKKGTTALTEGATVVGSKTNKLTLKSIVAADAAQYYCEVTSDCFASPLVSQQATVTILPSTSISNQPTASVVCPGATGVFTVIAGGTSLTYQWRKGTVNLTESATAVGTKSSVLNIKNVKVTDAGDYSCVVSGQCGVPITSTSASLSITGETQITQQPVSKEICAGASTSFSITATGANLTYSWKKGNTVLTNGGKYSGVTTSTLNITSATSAEEGQYSCSISSSCINEIISTVAQLSIGTAPSITGKSADLKLCPGEVAKMSVTVSSGLVTYQWKKNGVALVEGNGILGSKARELFILSIKGSDAGNYTCEISSGCGSSQVSGVIKLELSSEITIDEQALTQRHCNGEKISITAAVTGTVQSYQWKKNGANLVNNASVSGVKTATLVLAKASLADEGFYSCELLSACGTLALTNNVKLEINPKPELSLLEVNCDAFPTEWSSLVLDVNSVFGDYTIFRKGNTTPLSGLNAAVNNGLYLIVKNAGECSDSVEWNNDCVITGIEKTLADFAITPNPSSGIFKVKHEMDMQHFEVYDLRGVQVLADQLTAGMETFVDASQLADGVYYFTSFNREGKRISKRILIQR